MLRLIMASVVFLTATMLAADETCKQCISKAHEEGKFETSLPDCWEFDKDGQLVESENRGEENADQ